MKILKKENGWRSLGQGCDNLLRCILQPGFPELGANILDLGVTEGIETSHIGHEILVRADQVLYARFDFLPYFFRWVPFLDFKCPTEQINQREIRDVLGMGIGMSLPPLDLLEIQGGLELLNEPALSRACISTNRENPAFPLSEILDGFTKLGYLRLSADEIGPQAGKAMYGNRPFLWSKHFMNLDWFLLPFYRCWF